jgi:hypothetical protein
VARLFYLVRFFRVVPPVPPLMVTTFVVITGMLSVAVVIYRQQTTAAALGPVLLLQAFAAASSFTGPSRRGYYDLLLSRGEGRATIAAVQWLASIVPGVLAWLVVAGVERAVAGPSRALGFSTGTAAAMLLVSTLPWAATAALPRFAGAVGWLLVITVAGAASPLPAVGALTAPAAQGGFLRSALAMIADPRILVGRDVSASPAWWGPVLALSVLSMVTALLWIDRSDVPLEAAQ